MLRTLTFLGFILISVAFTREKGLAMERCRSSHENLPSTEFTVRQDLSNTNQNELK